MAAFTFERLIVVRYPLKRMEMCTVRRAKIIIGTLVLVAAIVQLITLFPSGVIEKKTTTSAGTRNGSSFYYSNGTNETTNGMKEEELPFHFELVRILNMLETGLTLVVPPVLVVIMNGLIIHKIFKSNKNFQTGVLSRHQGSSIQTTTVHNQENIAVNKF